MDKKIMIVKPGTLSAKDKEKLTKSGCVVVEHPLPSEVRIVQQVDEITGSAVLMSAMEAVVCHYSSREKFAESLTKRILATEKKQQP